MQTELFNVAGTTIDSSVNLLPKDGEVYVHPAFFTQAESDRFLEYLLHHISWQQDQIRFYGKSVDLPRLTSWFGDHKKDYSYSGINTITQPWTSELLEIKSRIETDAKIQFTSVLLNYYRNGMDHVSWHRDKEKALRINPVIASVSFGATRTFRFRHINDRKLIRSSELHHGTYLLMKGKTQEFWEHQVPKAKGLPSPRINLTFRIME